MVAKTLAGYMRDMGNQVMDCAIQLELAGKLSDPQSLRRIANDLRRWADNTLHFDDDSWKPL